MKFMKKSILASVAVTLSCTCLPVHAIETNVIDEMNRPIDKKVKTAKVVTTDDVWGSFS